MGPGEPRTSPFREGAAEVLVRWRYLGPAARLLFRIPIGLYRLGLGPLIGGIPVGRGLRPGILVLTTRGRATGRPRTTALEYRELEGTFYVVAAWGRRSDWLRNIERDPRVRVAAGRRSFRGLATIPSTPAQRQEAVEAWLRTGRCVTAWFLRVVGISLGSTEARQRLQASRLTIVSITPAETRP